MHIIFFNAPNLFQNVIKVHIRSLERNISISKLFQCPHRYFFAIVVISPLTAVKKCKRAGASRANFTGSQDTSDRQQAMYYVSTFVGHL